MTKIRVDGGSCGGGGGSIFCMGFLIELDLVVVCVALLQTSFHFNYLNFFARA